MKSRKRVSLFKAVLCAILCAVALLALLVLYALFIEPHNLTVNKVKVKTELPIKNAKIVLFTDTHFGRLYSSDNAPKITELINAQDADIVVFTGDLFDNYALDTPVLDMETIESALSGIKAKGGKYAIWGNHDYGGGAKRIYEQLLTKCGFTLLLNDNVFLPEYNINIVGYDDYLLGYTPPQMHTNDYDGFNLLLSHEPIIASQISNSGDNLLLSGHTHGGQVYIPFITQMFTPSGSGSYIKGLYSSGDIGTSTRINMYTSSGIGLTKFPLRLFNPPEIVLIDLSGTK